jgi:hypothetical protein
VSALTIGTLVMAAAAVCASIGSVLLLSWRVGQLTGSSTARIKQGEDDRAAIWQAFGVLSGRFDRHTEQHTWRQRSE